jgi:hypothetical protein
MPTGGIRPWLKATPPIARAKPDIANEKAGRRIRLMCSRVVIFIPFEDFPGKVKPHPARQIIASPFSS